MALPYFSLSKPEPTEGSFDDKVKGFFSKFLPGTKPPAQNMSVAPTPQSIAPKPSMMSKATGGYKDPFASIDEIVSKAKSFVPKLPSPDSVPTLPAPKPSKYTMAEQSQQTLDFLKEMAQSIPHGIATLALSAGHAIAPKVIPGELRPEESNAPKVARALFGEEPIRAIGPGGEGSKTVSFLESKGIPSPVAGILGYGLSTGGEALNAMNPFSGAGKKVAIDLVAAKTEKEVAEYLAAKGLAEHFSPREIKTLAETSDKSVIEKMLGRKSKGLADDLVEEAHAKAAAPEEKAVTSEIPTGKTEPQMPLEAPGKPPLPVSSLPEGALPPTPEIVPKVPSSTNLIPKEVENVNRIQKITKAIEEAIPVRAKQERMYSAERGKKLGAALGTKSATGGEAGFYKELGQLKGSLTKVDFESLRGKIDQTDIDALFNQVATHPELSVWEQINAREGLAKIFGKMGGTVPTEGELKLLQKVFPKEFVDTLVSKKPIFSRIGQGIVQALNIPRSIMSSFDLSAPFRQGVFMVGKKRFYQAFGSMFKSFGSEAGFKAVQDSIHANPFYDMMKESKLALTDLGTPLTEREEQFMSNWAEKIPGLGKVIRASGRAYTGFLNKLRSDVFTDLVKNAKIAGVDIESKKVVDDISKFINNATGRGTLLKDLEPAAQALNGVFFSPRLMASRLNMLNPAFYVKLDPFVRKEALKSLLSFGAIAGSVLGLAKLAGAKVSGDPTNADFGKIKIGNTRIDILGGFQQYIRLASQLIAGKITSSTTGKTFTLGEGYKPVTRLDILARFFQGKENPVASFVTDMLEGKTVTGEPFKLDDALISRFTPMITQDLQDAIKEWGPVGALSAVPITFGMGVQTYSAESSKAKTTKSKSKSTPSSGGLPHF